MNTQKIVIRKKLYLRLLAPCLAVGGIFVFALGIAFFYVVIDDKEFNLAFIAGGLLFLYMGLLFEYIFISSFTSIVIDEKETTITIERLGIVFKKFSVRDFEGYNRIVVSNPYGQQNAILLHTKENYQIAFSEEETENYSQLSEAIASNLFLKPELKYRRWTTAWKSAMGVLVVIGLMLLLGIALDQMKH